MPVYRDREDRACLPRHFLSGNAATNFEATRFQVHLTEDVQLWHRRAQRSQLRVRAASQWLGSVTRVTKSRPPFSNLVAEAVVLMAGRRKPRRQWHRCLPTGIEGYHAGVQSAPPRLHILYHAAHINLVLLKDVTLRERAHAQGGTFRVTSSEASSL